jgi:hypothetical protein
LTLDFTREETEFLVCEMTKFLEAPKTQVTRNAKPRVTKGATLVDEPFCLHVAPRYTPGSPALVSRQTGEGVANDERWSYQHHLDGRYGQEGIDKARRLGLKGIVWERVEQGRRFYFYDLLTEERWQEKVKV